MTDEEALKEIDRLEKLRKQAVMSVEQYNEEDVWCAKQSLAELVEWCAKQSLAELVERKESTQ